MKGKDSLTRGRVLPFKNSSRDLEGRIAIVEADHRLPGLESSVTGRVEKLQLERVTALEQIRVELDLSLARMASILKV